MVFSTLIQHSYWIKWLLLCFTFPLDVYNIIIDVESADGDSSSSERSFKTGSEGPTALPKRSHGSGKKKYAPVMLIT